MLIDYLTLLERVTPLMAQIGLLPAPEWGTRCGEHASKPPPPARK